MSTPPAARLAVLRDAAWLDASRARRWATILFAVLVVAAAAWILTARDLVDAAGRPLGTDFLSFYAAAKLALSGLPTLAWDQAAHATAETAVFGRDLGYWAFFYPPPFLLVVLPFGLPPYPLALLLWIGATTAAAIVLTSRQWPGIPWIALLAAPALWLNLGHGQNAALTLALLVGGFALADRRPFLAGLVLGCLIIKPQLALALPVIALTAGRWRLIAGAVVSVAALAGLSLAVFGLESWRAFLAAAPLARAALEDDLVGAHKMVSVFAAIRLLGGSLALAYTGQAIAAAGTLAAIAVVVRRHRPDGAPLAALAAAATPLLSPFLLDYDLCVLLPALAWAVTRGARAGFRPYEKVLLLVAYVLPLVSRSLGAAGLPLAPLATAAVLVLILSGIGCGYRSVRQKTGSSTDTER